MHAEPATAVSTPSALGVMKALCSAPRVDVRESNGQPAPLHTCSGAAFVAATCHRTSWSSAIASHRGEANSASGRMAFAEPCAIRMCCGVAPGDGPIGLVMAPTRELAMQIQAPEMVERGGGRSWEGSRALVGHGSSFCISVVPAPASRRPGRLLGTGHACVSAELRWPPPLCAGVGEAPRRSCPAPSHMLRHPRSRSGGDHEVHPCHRHPLHGRVRRSQPLRSGVRSASRPFAVPPQLSRCASRWHHPGSFVRGQSPPPRAPFRSAPLRGLLVP